MRCGYAPLNASREGQTDAAQWAHGTRVGDAPQAGVPSGSPQTGQRLGWGEGGRPVSRRMLPAPGSHPAPALFTGASTDACGESR